MYNLRLTHKEIGVKDIPEAGRKLEQFVLTNSLKDYVLLQTCNRAELYYNGAIAAQQNGFIFESGESACRHLLRVACGLESFVVGETEILGQLRNAYKVAKQRGHCSSELSRYFEIALRVGRRARSKTGISRGKVSVVSLALDYVQDLLGDLRGKKVLVIGAGNIGTKVARSLKNTNVERILITNRHYERAVELAREIDAEAYHLSHLNEVLNRADIVICATSAPHLILTRERIKKTNRKLIVIDLSVPKNVEESIKSLENIELVTFEDLKGKADKNLEERKREVEKVERLIEREMVSSRDVKMPGHKKVEAPDMLSRRLPEKFYNSLHDIESDDCHA